MVTLPPSTSAGRYPLFLSHLLLAAKGIRVRGSKLIQNSFVEGLGLGGATMIAPTYVSENSPRAIRGLLIGFYQLFETMGAMVAFFIDYGSLLHLKVS